MLYEIRETDAEASISSEQQTASQTGENFHQKKAFSRSQPRTKKPCPSCVHLEAENQKLNSMLSQMKRVEQLLLNQIRDLKHQIEETLKTLSRNQLYVDDLNRELKTCQEKLHAESMANGQHSKVNIDLKKSILMLEQEALTTSKQMQELGAELAASRAKYAHEHKFIESLLHMVMSCHPDSSFREPPSLKQAWKWLKMILSDYMSLKQQSKRMDFQESSGQSSSSTNK